MTAAAVSVAAFFAVAGIAILATWHTYGWDADRKQRQAAYEARLRDRLERIQEDDQYDRLKALADRPYDGHRHDLGDAMLLATVHALDATYTAMERETA